MHFLETDWGPDKGLSTEVGNKHGNKSSANTLVNVYVDLVVFTRIAGTS